MADDRQTDRATVTAAVRATALPLGAIWGVWDGLGDRPRNDRSHRPIQRAWTRGTFGLP